MLNKKDLVVASAAALGIASVGFADLLGLNTDFPFLFYSTTQPTATNYDASTDLFMVTSSPVAIFVAVVARFAMWSRMPMHLRDPRRRPERRRRGRSRRARVLLRRAPDR